MQAGSYIENIKSHLELSKDYANELATFIAPFLSSEKSLLDVGTGELTTFSLLLSNKDINPLSVYAFDISWSRLYRGLDFWKDNVKNKEMQLNAFVADIKEIPIASKSIDIVTSCHALEPNGGNITKLLKELFRICRDRLVLFEPSYELNSKEGKARMDRLGYIKDIEGTVKKIGGVVHDIVPLRNTSDPLNPTAVPLNPTACFIIEPSTESDKYFDSAGNLSPFTVPGSDYKISERDGFFISAETGIAFPILKGIPKLKLNAGILATSLC